MDLSVDRFVVSRAHCICRCNSNWGKLACTDSDIMLYVTGWLFSLKFICSVVMLDICRHWVSFIYRASRHTDSLFSVFICLQTIIRTLSAVWEKCGRRVHKEWSSLWFSKIVRRDWTQRYVCSLTKWMNFIWWNAFLLMDWKRSKVLSFSISNSTLFNSNGSAEAFIQFCHSRS